MVEIVVAGGNCFVIVRFEDEELTSLLVVVVKLEGEDVSCGDSAERFVDLNYFVGKFGLGGCTGGDVKDKLCSNSVSVRIISRVYRLLGILRLAAGYQGRECDCTANYPFETVLNINFELNE